MQKKYGIYGGSFNPPGLHHLELIREFTGIFDEVIIYPCGPRSDKSTTNTISLENRRNLCKLAFSIIERTRLDCSDLNNAVFTPSIDLLQKFSSLGELWLIIGSDLIKGGKTNSSEIQKSWHKGQELWNNANFFIVSRVGYTLDTADLPPKNKTLMLNINGSSKEIREAIKKGIDISALVDDEIKKYIYDHNLYN